MKISVVITVFNEEDTISRLLDSLLCQTEKPYEIVIVDGDSKDNTVEIIKHFQKKNRRIRLLVQKCSRARGRNLGVEIARGEIIAMTDAGCIAEEHWLERITEPFEIKDIEMTAGFYKMTGESPLQKAEKIFMGVRPSRFDINFLPSTRSIAFRKSLWEKVGGFPENLEDAAEDTVFNCKVIKARTKISRMKNAIVEWGMPETIQEFQSKIFQYAKGDAESKIWFFPGKGLMSHNIKVLLIFARYLIAAVVLLLSIRAPFLLAYLTLGLIIYIYWAYRKAGLWGIVLQFIADFAVMSGFIAGTIGR